MFYYIWARDPRTQYSQRESEDTVMKKLMALLLALAMLLALTGCGETLTPTEPTGTEAEDETEATIEQVGENKVVGIAMPNQSSERWINDGGNMKSQLEELGYEVVLQYADDNVRTQVAQIEEMVALPVDCLVIASIDSLALTDVEARAKEAGIPIIAYDRLLMQTDAVTYYASFDNVAIGRAIGEYIERAKDLPNTTESYTIEFFMGSPDDNNAQLVYEGVMEVLGPYLTSGVLECRSGMSAFEETCILRWSRETAEKTLRTYLKKYYSREKLDICCTAFDGFAYGCADALEAAGYKVGKNWPLITGQDAEAAAVRNIISGRQTMSVAKDTRLLAEKCVTMVNALLTGSKPEINDTTAYDNGVFAVSAYLCTPVVVDQTNYREILIDTGYYTEEQLTE